MGDILTHLPVLDTTAEANAGQRRMMWLNSIMAGLVLPLAAACASPNSDSDTTVVAAPDAAPSPPVATAEPFPSASPDIEQLDGTDTGNTAPENTGAGDFDPAAGIWPLDKLYEWSETATPPDCGPNGESAVSVAENPDGSLDVTVRIWNAQEIGSESNVIASVESYVIDNGIFISSRLVQLIDGVAIVNIPAKEASELKSNPSNDLITKISTVPKGITPELIIENLPKQGEMGLPNMGVDKNGEVVHDISGVPGMYLVILSDGLDQAPPDVSKPFFPTAICS